MRRPRGRDGGWALGHGAARRLGRGGAKQHLGSCWILEGVCSAVRCQPAGPAKSEPAPTSATTARSDTPAQADEVVDESIDERAFVICYPYMFSQPPAVTRTGGIICVVLRRSSFLRQLSTLRIWYQRGRVYEWLAVCMCASVSLRRAAYGNAFRGRDAMYVCMYVCKGCYINT